MTYNPNDARPYLEQVASGHISDPPVDDFNPAFAVQADLGTVVQRQKAQAEQLPTVNRERAPRVRGAGGSPIVDAAIRTLERATLTDAQRAKLRDLLA